MKTTQHFAVKYRWPILSVFFAITIFMGMQIPRLSVDSDPEHAMPANMPSRIATDKINAVFGNTDAVMIVFETNDVLNAATLTRVQKISKEISHIKGVDKVMSLFEAKRIVGQGGAMIVDPAIAQIPSDSAQREKLRSDLKDNKMVYKMIVSSDFKFTTIIGLLSTKLNEPDKHVVVAQIQQIINQTPGAEKTSLGGRTVLMDRINHDVIKDVQTLMGIALLLMMVVLFIFFKQKRGVLLPFGTVVMSIVVGMGAMPLLGWTMTAVSNLLPIMIIAIANNYGIYFISRYQEINTPGNSLTKKEIAGQTIQSLWKPVLMTGIVAIVGILGLLWHAMLSVKQLGVLLSISIAFAVAMSLLFIPAMLSLLRIPKPIALGHADEKHAFDTILLKGATIVASNPKKIFGGFLILFVVFLSGVSFVQIDADIANMFPKDHPVRVTTDLINKYFGGAENISVLVEGDVKDPALLKKLDDYQTEMAKIPEVGNTSSMATVVRELSKALNNKDEPGYDKIPDTRDAVAQYLELYSMSGDPKDFDRIVDFNYTKTCMNIALTDVKPGTIKKVLARFKELSQGDPTIAAVGGTVVKNNDILGAILTGQRDSLLFAIVVIFILLGVLFRSFKVGLIGIIPVTFSIVMLFGIMGFFNVHLDTALALLSSVVVGLGTDLAIHFLWKYREERAHGLDYRAAVVKTITTRGRGIIFNALAIVAGFCALFFSLFPALKAFGLLFVVSITGCLLGTLILMPAICLIFKPKSLEPNKKIV